MKEFTKDNQPNPTPMKQGDFTKLASDYRNRPGYSETVLNMISDYVGASHAIQTVADVGAGTGKLTEILGELGFRGYAIEPNDAMREAGSYSCHRYAGFEWSKGVAEKTGLLNSSVDWVLMASSFHWTNPNRSLPEFHRILRNGGALTVLWNPRDVERCPLQTSIDCKIKEMVPNLKRVSSGSQKYTKNVEETLLSTGHFEEVVFVEAPHEVSMNKERYMGAWRSVNDIQAQAGPELFQEILSEIESMIEGQCKIVVPYRTRSWTVRPKKF